MFCVSNTSYKILRLFGVEKEYRRIKQSNRKRETQIQSRKKEKYLNLLQNKKENRALEIDFEIILRHTL